MINPGTGTALRISGTSAAKLFSGNITSQRHHISLRKVEFKEHHSLKQVDYLLSHWQMEQLQ
jgi:hypothetical protein